MDAQLLPSIPALAEKITEFEKQEKEADENGTSLSTEFYDQKEILIALYNNKVDDAALLLKKTEVKIQALEMALSKAQNFLATAKECFELALKSQGVKKIDGLAFQIRMKTNGGKPAVFIDNEDLVPDEFKSYSVTIKESVELTDVQRQRVLASVLLKKALTPDQYLNLEGEDKEKVDRAFKKEIKKSKIEAQLKTQPDSVPGVHLHRGEHLEVTPSISKFPLLEEK